MRKALKRWVSGKIDVWPTWLPVAHLAWCLYFGLLIYHAARQNPTMADLVFVPVLLCWTWAAVRMRNSGLAFRICLLLAATSCALMAIGVLQVMMYTLNEQADVGPSLTAMALILQFALLVVPSGALLALTIRSLFPQPPVVVEPPRCDACGYDLTGNTSGTSPECGSACNPL
jgi:hypothetical protein